MSDLIEQFRGRVVDSPGDNLLSEFSSVVDAVQCAVEIHEVIQAKNEELPEGRRMLFRIGVNLGDVIEEGNRIYNVLILVSAYMEKGLLEEAMSELKEGLSIFPKEPILLMLMGTIYALREEKEKTRAILDELLERSKKEYVTPFAFVLLYAALGEINSAFEYLEKGYEKRDIFLMYIKLTLPHLLRGDPRVKSFFKKIGL